VYSTLVLTFPSANGSNVSSCRSIINGSRTTYLSLCLCKEKGWNRRRGERERDRERVEAKGSPDGVMSQYISLPLRPSLVFLRSFSFSLCSIYLVSSLQRSLLDPTDWIDRKKANNGGPSELCLLYSVFHCTLFIEPLKKPRVTFPIAFFSFLAFHYYY